MDITDQLLHPTLPHDTVCRVVHDSWQAHERAEYRLSLGLRRLFRDNVHRGRGFSQFGDFAEHEFGIPEKLAWMFSALGKHLERLPATREALEKGHLTYTKVREFMALASPEDETRWIEFARTHTNRELEARVARARDESAGREHEPRKEVTSRLTPREVQATRTVREDLLKQTGKVVPEAELLGTLVTAAAEGKLPVGDTKPKTRPYVTIALCPTCAETWVPVAGLDMDVRIQDWLDQLRAGAEFVNVLEDQLCDCPAVKHRRDRCPRPRARWEPSARSRHVPADVRRPVEARDGHRCRVPGCTCDGPLEISHLVRYADGAPTTPETVAQHCRPHNAMIETGRLVVKGRAPFERYFLTDGTFLGTGGDPRPAEQGFPHVENAVMSQVQSREPPGTGRRRPA